MTDDLDINKACAEALEKKITTGLDKPYLVVDGGSNFYIGNEWTPLTDAKQANECRDELLKRECSFFISFDGTHAVFTSPKGGHDFTCHPDRFFAEALAWVQGEGK